MLDIGILILQIIIPILALSHHPSPYGDHRPLFADGVPEFNAKSFLNDQTRMLDIAMNSQQNFMQFR
jgi:hypothetical protein